MSDMSSPGQELISVIVAVKNGAASLQGCIDSVATQSWKPLEIIVIDGASTDGTREILEENLRTERISGFVSEPDRGICDAWNKALRRMHGQWACFLGADDRFHDVRAIGDLIAARRQGVRVIYGRVELTTPRGVVGAVHGGPWPQARAAFLEGVMIPHPGALHHRSIFAEHGFYDESYRIAGDYELLLRELLRGDALFVDRVVVNMRFGGMSSTPRAIHSMLREVQRARAKNGLRGTPASLRVRLLASWLGTWIERWFGEQAYRWVADGYRVIRGKPRIWTV